jgi:hypothetical protein
VAFSSGSKLTASQLNNFSPSGNVTAGGNVQAATPLTVSDIQMTNGTTGSTTFTATLTGGTACGVVFTAPTSGKVMVHNNCGLFNTTDFSICGYEVRTGNVVGSGTVVQAVDDDHALITKATNLDQRGNQWPLTGLTAGNEYNVRQLYRVVSGTGNFQRKNLSVVPQM